MTQIPAELANRVRLILFDVDGVLTDAGVYIGEDSDGQPIEFKRFDIQDGLGIKMLMWAGLTVAFVSGRISAATTLRADELGVGECFQDAGARKLPWVESLLGRMSLTWENVAMLADDLPDLPVFRKVGLPAAVANAVPEIAKASAWRSSRKGGRGAAREFCEALLRARGEWDALVDDYCAERSGDQEAADV